MKWIAFLLVFSVALSGCGSVSDSIGDAVADKAAGKILDEVEASINVKDAFVDGLEHVYVTFGEVSLKDENNLWVYTDNEPVTVDLLAYQEEESFELVKFTANNVAYTKIRIPVLDVEAHDASGPIASSVELDTVEIDIDFELEAGFAALIDFDLSESFDEDGGFRPFVKNVQLSSKDTDGDGVNDFEDTDDDNDGIPDHEDDDVDGDGMQDSPQQTGARQSINQEPYYVVWGLEQEESEPFGRIVQDDRASWESYDETDSFGFYFGEDSFAHVGYGMELRHFDEFQFVLVEDCDGTIPLHVKYTLLEWDGQTYTEEASVGPYDYGWGYDCDGPFRQLMDFVPDRLSVVAMLDSRDSGDYDLLIEFFPQGDFIGWDNTLFVEKDIHANDYYQLEDDDFRIIRADEQQFMHGPWETTEHTFLGTTTLYQGETLTFVDNRPAFEPEGNEVYAHPDLRLVGLDMVITCDGASTTITLTSGGTTQTLDALCFDGVQMVGLETALSVDGTLDIALASDAEIRIDSASFDIPTSELTDDGLQHPASFKLDGGTDTAESTAYMGSYGPSLNIFSDGIGGPYKLTEMAVVSDCTATNLVTVEYTVVVSDGSPSAGETHTDTFDYDCEGALIQVLPSTLPWTFEMAGNFHVNVEVTGGAIDYALMVRQ